MDGAIPVAVMPTRSIPGCKPKPPPTRPDGRLGEAHEYHDYAKEKRVQQLTDVFLERAADKDDNANDLKLVQISAGSPTPSENMLFGAHDYLLRLRRYIDGQAEPGPSGPASGLAEPTGRP